MIAALLVRVPGLHTSVQDRGRFGHRRIGVPRSGALDGDALRLLNGLLGNEEDAAALECLGLGATLQAVDGPVRVALGGCAPAAAVVAPDGARRPAPAWASLRLEPGDTLAVGPLARFNAVLAIEGGVRVDPVLGSRSTYGRGGFGGFAGRALRAGDRLDVEAATNRPDMRLADPPADDPAAPVRVVLGPQDDHFTADGLDTFLRETWCVTVDADRMGFRLDGATIAHVRGPDIVSDGAVAGSIQVPGSGRPIVLLADGQSVGGYSKIATIASADLARFSRRRPGEIVRFAAVTQGEAEQLARRHDKWLRGLVAGMMPARDGLDLAALYEANLVSGVVSA